MTIDEIIGKYAVGRDKSCASLKEQFAWLDFCAKVRAGMDAKRAWIIYCNAVDRGGLK